MKKCFCNEEHASISDHINQLCSDVDYEGHGQWPNYLRTFCSGVKAVYKCDLCQFMCISAMQLSPHQKEKHINKRLQYSTNPKYPSLDDRERRHQQYRFFTQLARVVAKAPRQILYEIFKKGEIQSWWLWCSWLCLWATSATAIHLCSICMRP